MSDGTGTITFSCLWVLLKGTECTMLVALTVNDLIV